MGARDADFISFFINVPINETIWSHFHFHNIFKNGGSESGPVLLRTPIFVIFQGGLDPRIACV